MMNRIRIRGSTARLGEAVNNPVERRIAMGLTTNPVKMIGKGITRVLRDNLVGISSLATAESVPTNCNSCSIVGMSLRKTRSS